MVADFVYPVYSEITKENKQDRQNLLPLSMPEADRPYIIYVRDY
jgi:hypothetical protein